MSKIPKSPDEIFQQFTTDYKNIFGDDLISIILFGSAARGEYIHKRSDINFLITLSESGMQRLKQAFSLIPKWRKKQVSTPLFLTNQYIQTALDSYPIEFLSMKQHHQVVYGVDVLSQIKIQSEHLRLQCERELRGKLIHLRQEYLNTGGKSKRIKHLVRFSLPAFVSIFSALLYLKQAEIPKLKKEIFLNTAEIFALDKAVFDKVLKLQANKSKLSKEEITGILEQYINQIQQLTIIVDEL
jgi:predicted nucleotidyltransferase